MRKSNIMFLCDTIFWYIIYFLPVILYGIYLIHGSEGNAPMDISTFCSTKLSMVVSTEFNPIFISLRDLFGYNGLIPLFGQNNQYILVIVSYFASMLIVHLCVDFLLFIPRLCHKWMDMYTKGVEK